jgi:hypothetical protein
MSVIINRGRTYQALRDAADKTPHDRYGQQTQQTTRIRTRWFTNRSVPKISLSATHSQNPRVTAPHVIDRKLEGDLHNASRDGGRAGGGVGAIGMTKGG